MNVRESSRAPEPPMTVKELSDYLRLDRMTIYKMLKEGDIPAFRIGHQWRFFRDDIDKWIRSKRVGQLKPILLLAGEGGVKFERLETAFEVTALESGEGFLDALQDTIFSFVVLPLNEEGIEIFRKLQSKEAELDVQVYLINDAKSRKYIDQAMDIGPFILLKAPVSPEAFRGMAESFKNV